MILILQFLSRKTVFLEYYSKTPYLIERIMFFVAIRKICLACYILVVVSTLFAFCLDSF
jgi:hypothetical protein